MKVLLIASNRIEKPLPAFPLGAAYLAGNIDPMAHSVDVLDLMFEDNFKELVASEVSRVNPDIIGVSIRNLDVGRVSPLPEIEEIIEICRRESEARVVLGGSGFTRMPREIITHFGADLGVVGEGVVTFNRLLERLETGAGWDDIPGLVWKDDGQVRVNDSTKDEMPDDFNPPARTLFNYQRYSEQGWLSANVLVKRGCPFECLWDDIFRQEGARFRSRTPRSVVDELEMLTRDLGINSATLVAPKFNYPEDYARELCEEMIARNLGLSWMTDLHPYPSSPDLFKLMKRAGCIFVSIDAGACSEKMLEKMAGDYRLDDIRKCCADLESAELNFAFLTFFGGPGETKETVEESLAFLDKINPMIVDGQIGLRIYPDTPLVEIALEEGVISEDQDLYKPVFYVEEDIKDWLHERLAKVSAFTF